MKILIGCEESQAVCIEMRKLGHEAYSCDLIDCSGDHPEWHIKGDVVEAIKSRKWDFIGLHLPCTCVTVSGNSTYGLEKDGTPKPRHSERIKAVLWMEFVWSLAISVCDKVYLENPVGVLRSMSDVFPNPQYVQPWMFGHTEKKRTGLFLHGLPRLKETNNVKEEMQKLPKNVQERLHYLPPSEDRAKLRSKTFPGIAKAMAEQWTKEAQK